MREGYERWPLAECGTWGFGRQGDADRVDVSSLLEKSEEGSTCCRSSSCPSLCADTQPRPEAAPGPSRGLAVFFPSEESFIDVLHQRTFLVIPANFN